MTRDLFGDFCRGLGKLDSQRETLNVAKDQKEKSGHRHRPSTGTVRADKPEAHDTQNHLATTEARVQRDTSSGHLVWTLCPLFSIGEAGRPGTEPTGGGCLQTGAGGPP